MRLAATALAALLLTTASAAALAAPRARWLSDDIDFGAFHESLGTVTDTLLAVNDGDAPLAVVKARSNCGCTTPRYSTDAVAPGDTLAVVVGYNAAGRPGKFSKKITVVTNDGQQTAFMVHGTVIGLPQTLAERYPVEGAPGVRLREPVMFFGPVKKTGVKGQYIEGYNATADSLALAVADRPRWITAMVSPEVVAPGEQFVLTATFSGAECPVWDSVTDTLVVATGPTLRLTVPTAATVEEDFSLRAPGAPAPLVRVTPASIPFDEPLDTVAGKPVRRSLRIANLGKAPLNVRRAYCADPAVTLRGRIDRPVKPGGKADIEVIVDPRLLAGRDLLDARVVLVTDDPDTPRTVLRLTAPLR